MAEAIRRRRINGRRADGISAAYGTRPDALGQVIAWVALVAVFVHATQASFDVLAWTGKAHLRLTPVDVVIWVAFGLWFVRRILRKNFSRPAVSLAAVGGVVWLGLSLIPFLKGGGPDEAPIAVSLWGVKEVVQFFEYYIAAYIVFTETFRDRRWLERSVMALGLTVLLSLACGLALYFSESVHAVAVRGAGFANRNTFGGFLAMALPLLFGVALFSGRPSQLMVGILILLAGLCVCLAGGPVLAICVGVLVVVSLKGKVPLLVTAVALMLLGWQVWPRMPRNNGAALLDSVLLYRQSDPYEIYGGGLADILDEQGAHPLTKLKGRIRAGESLGPSAVPTADDLSWRWQKRYKEWQAALNMMARSPLFGVGAGGYQANVGVFYYQKDGDASHRMPRYATKNLIEPDTHSGYMVWGASAGVPFLIIIFAMLVRAARSAGRCFVSQSDSLKRGMAAGILGSLAAVAVVSVFGDPLVRGVGVTLVLLLAWAEALSRGDEIEEARDTAGLKEESQ